MTLYYSALALPHTADKQKSAKPCHHRHVAHVRGERSEQNFFCNKYMRQGTKFIAKVRITHQKEQRKVPLKTVAVVLHPQ
jgi:hypothetical protein